jgi:hypothetical protein
VADPVTDLVADDRPEDAKHYGVPEVQVALLNQHAGGQEDGRAREWDACGPEHYAEQHDQVPIVLDEWVELLHCVRSIVSSSTFGPLGFGA